jgi:hypothetical protein
MTKRKKTAENLTIRPTIEDKKLLATLEAKLGVSVSQVIRLGLRALATKEGLSA